MTPVNSVGYTVCYLCTTLIKSSLKDKLIKQIHKQYNSEVKKKKKVDSFKQANSIGKQVELHVSGGEGVTIRDKNDVVLFEFSSLLVGQFIKHPTGIGCFGFTVLTKDPTTNTCHETRVHMFLAKQEVLPKIEAAFRALAAHKEVQSLYPM